MDDRQRSASRGVHATRHATKMRHINSTRVGVGSLSLFVLSFGFDAECHVAL